MGAVDRKEATAALSELIYASVVAGLFIAIVAAMIVGLVIARLLQRLSLVNNALEDIASGSRDLTQRLDAGGDDELSQIAASFNRFVDQICNVMVEIIKHSGFVNRIAAEFGAGNMELSKRTERQASSLEESASALEQLAVTVQHSVEAYAAAAISASC